MTPSSALTLESARGIGQLQFQIPNTPVASRHAREWLTGPLRASHPVIADDVLLCLSEAVANAHRHTTSSMIRVDSLIIEASVLVQVHDDRPGGLPAPADPRADAEHGRGLTLIEACSDAWGVVPRGGPRSRGKTVWFVVLTRGSEEG
ncbi:ATP-binding protein [Streptomyces sp. NPDC005963]|uniref:ATP-binding protein n=1 Tax=Streptomyces sp. NPDC005963 TaxID=3156721 RepID=UPI00340E51A0